MSDYERSIGLTVNGTPSTVLVVPSMTLLDLVRTRLKLTGSKECCSEGECGACTMIVDGEPVNSCLVLAVEADGSVVVTIEGIGAADMTPLQESFLSAGAVQCGFCIPGMVVAATSLLERSPHPTKSEIREGMSGNLCRCGGYDFISTAVLLAAASGGSDG
jgi:aerobic-type carbon monoxide dehydrogenase small subunit (CoxS/CutS family)